MFKFGSQEEWNVEELRAAPSHYPRPSRLTRELEIKPPKAAKAAEQIGLTTIGSLFTRLPFRHDDRGDIQQVALLRKGEDATVAVEIERISKRQAYNRARLTIVEAKASDETGSVKAVWFNQPWLVGKLSAGDRVVLHGRFEGARGFRVSEFELAQGAAQSDEASNKVAGVVPVYPATEGLPSAKIRELIHSYAGAQCDFTEGLPSGLLIRRGLPNKVTALTAVHFPESDDDATGGRERLAYEELLLMQLAILRRREERKVLKAVAIADPADLTKRWIKSSLPFVPTDDQIDAMAAVEKDLRLEHPMQRLLMGEVGSGKTVVALYAMLRAVESGQQTAFMAPTETLAEQHFQTLQQLMPGELLQTALLTGSTPPAAKRDTLGKLSSGELKVVVGTHALIEDTVEFDSLAVAIVDEQHRFGVRQRAALDSKGRNGDAVHVLHMTATPITRTLSLTVYGDLDVTMLRQLPKGRRPIATHIASTAPERARAYERVREEIAKGRQVFIVCPLVEESEVVEAKAATVEYERLRNGELRDYRVALLHGQMSSKEKQAAMRAFADGEADVLVATTVIEVGIDIPNASTILVEGAERFGISQLHQLRGRVGRGEYDSLCLLFGPKSSPRLQALSDSSDGFELAEVDLQLRGEGEVIGTRQSGMQRFAVARMPEDLPLLELARGDVDEILSIDPELESAEHCLLLEAVERRFGSEAQAPIPA